MGEETGAGVERMQQPATAPDGTRSLMTRMVILGKSSELLRLAAD